MRWPDDFRTDPRSDAVSALEREGAMPVGDMPRLAEALAVDPEPERLVTWQTALTAVVREPGEFMLELQAGASLPLPCRRCLEAVDVQVDVRASFRLIPNQAEVANRDVQAKSYDVLWLDPDLAVAELIEDELLLNLPMMPVHAQCPEGAVQTAASTAAHAEVDAAMSDTQRPFADLAGLLKKGGS